MQTAVPLLPVNPTAAVPLQQLLVTVQPQPHPSFHRRSLQILEHGLLSTNQYSLLASLGHRLLMALVKVPGAGMVVATVMGALPTVVAGVALMVMALGDRTAGVLPHGNPTAPGVTDRGLSGGVEAPVLIATGLAGRKVPGALMLRGLAGPAAVPAPRLQALSPQLSVASKPQRRNMAFKWLRLLAQEAAQGARPTVSGARALPR